MEREVYKFIVLWCVLLAIDLVSKYYFFDQEFLSHYALIEPVMNFWISFSWGLSYTFVVPLTFVAIATFIHFYRKEYFSLLITTFLIAGTVGNLYDRIVYDGVRDFIVMFDWFVYNIADIYLSIAIIMVVFQFFFSKPYAAVSRKEDHS